MMIEKILDGNFRIETLQDEQGRRYYSIKIAFSNDDILTVYKENMQDLMEVLPNIISSAIKARVLTDAVVNY
ncbi:hypothetical protein [Caldithrix abyssi]|uniref:Uncharacterized protein n=2 Tax=Caldithrix abyssi DSM 13497 TaxID=880073 RepID=H1XXW3_CALAY|nr:hypothetical protein [Caldithrix abyssi]EHO40838.1 hypothetical protein Calab_1212 [Caldithrix abyssi DSM 13497]